MAAQVKTTDTTHSEVVQLITAGRSDRTDAARVAEGQAS